MVAGKNTRLYFFAICWYCEIYGFMLKKKWYLVHTMYWILGQWDVLTSCYIMHVYTTSYFREVFTPSCALIIVTCILSRKRGQQVLQKNVRIFNYYVVSHDCKVKKKEEKVYERSWKRIYSVRVVLNRVHEALQSYLRHNIEKIIILCNYNRRTQIFLNFILLS